MFTLINLLGFFLLTFLITGTLLFYFKKTSKFLDIPNERSSHFEAVPTAGGLSIVFSFITLISSMLLQELSLSIYLLLICSSLSISILSVIDDSLNLSALIRIIFQFLIAIFCVFLLHYI